MVLLGAPNARAQQEITLIAPNIIDDVIQELTKGFEAKTGIKVNVGFVSTHAKNPAAATQLLTFLSSPEAAAVYKAHKMQPGR